MKICFVTTGDILDIATSKRALGMANHLSDLGWLVSLLLEDSNENKKRVKLECNAYIKVHYYSKSNAINEFVQKNRIIKNIQPDFIYICAFVFRNIIIGSGKKLVEHSELQSGMAENKAYRKLKPLFFEHLSLFYSDGILYASRYLEKEFQKRLSISKKSKTPQLYFPYAYSPELLFSTKNSDKSVKTNEKNKRIFVYLGSLVENYGLFTMIKAFEIIQLKGIKVTLLLLGEGPDADKANKYIQDHNLSDTIQMPGYIAEEEIKDYFDQADAFISPMNNTTQDWARCPSKVYMYLPYRKPIVTCKIGEPFEVLGNNGYYYENGDAGSMADVCLGIITEECKASIVNPDLHTWKTRSIEFDNWVKQSF